jgi:hypothetical protein
MNIAPDQSHQEGKSVKHENPETDRQERLEEFALLRNRIATHEVSADPSQYTEMAAVVSKNETLLDPSLDSIPPYNIDDYASVLDKPFYESSDISEEAKAEGLKYIADARARRTYEGLTLEEQKEVSILRKSIEMDRKFIASKRAFIQELIKQGDKNSLEKIGNLRLEVETLEKEMEGERKKIQDKIISIIDKLEESTPGLKEAHEEERQTLTAKARAEKPKGLPARYTDRK